MVCFDLVNFSPKKRTGSTSRDADQIDHHLEELKLLRKTTDLKVTYLAAQGPNKGRTSF